jgi:hypothetical protein
MDAQALDCSVQGLSFNAIHQIKPQSSVCIIRKNYKPINYPDLDCSKIPVHSIAEVKWCMETSIARTSFEIGVEYTVPYLLTPSIIQRIR